MNTATLNITDANAYVTYARTATNPLLTSNVVSISPKKSTKPRSGSRLGGRYVKSTLNRIGGFVEEQLKQPFASMRREVIATAAHRAGLDLSMETCRELAMLIACKKVLLCAAHPRTDKKHITKKTLQQAMRRLGFQIKSRDYREDLIAAVEGRYEDLRATVAEAVRDNYRDHQQHAA